MMLRSAFGFDLDHTLLRNAHTGVTSPIAEQRWSPRFVFAVHEFAGWPETEVSRRWSIWPRSGGTQTYRHIA